MSFKSIRLYPVFIYQIWFQASERKSRLSSLRMRRFALSHPNPNRNPIVPKGKAKLSSRAQLYPKGKR